MPWSHHMQCRVITERLIKFRQWRYNHINQIGHPVTNYKLWIWFLCVIIVPLSLLSPLCNLYICLAVPRYFVQGSMWSEASWWHQMETFSALLAICAGNSPVTGEFPAQRPVTRNFDVFFDLRLNKRLSKNREAGDLRPNRAHYDVTVMMSMI